MSTKLRGDSPEQNTQLQLLHSDTHVAFGVFPSCQPESIPAARNYMAFLITTSASSILKACGRCRSRTGLTDIGAPHRSFSHDIHNRPYVRLFRTVNIMNRHVVTVNCCMILQESTSIDTLWTYMGFTILSQSTTFFHNIGRSHNDLKFPKVVRSLIQDCGKARDSNPCNLLVNLFSKQVR